MATCNCEYCNPKPETLCACCGERISSQLGFQMFADAPGVYCMTCDVPPGFQPLYGPHAKRKMVYVDAANLEEAHGAFDEAKRVLLNTLGVNHHKTIARIQRAQALLRAETTPFPASPVAPQPAETIGAAGSVALT